MAKHVIKVVEEKDGNWTAQYDDFPLWITQPTKEDAICELILYSDRIGIDLKVIPLPKIRLSRRTDMDKLVVYVTQGITGWWVAFTDAPIITYSDQRRDNAEKGILKLLGVDRKDVSFSTLLPHSEDKYA